MRKAVVLFVLLCGLAIPSVFFFFTGNQVSADSLPDSPQASPTPIPKSPLPPENKRLVILVGGDQNYPPYEFLENGVPAGFNVDLIRAVSKEMGFDVQIQLGEWNLVRQELDNGDINLIEGMAYSTDRDASYDFSVPFTYISFDLFVPDGSPIQHLEDATGKCIAVQNGGLMQEYLQEQGLTDQVNLVANAPDALALLANNTCDAALLNRMQGEYLIQHLGIKNVHRIGMDLLPQKYGFAVQNGDSALLASLNEGLSIVNSKGELAALQEKWFGVYQQSNPWLTIRQAALMLAGGLLLLALALFWVWSLRRQVDRRTAALAYSQGEYRALINNAIEGIVISQDDRLVFVNPAVAAVTGYSGEELIGSKFSDLIYSEDLVQVFDRYQRLLAGEKLPEFFQFRLVSRSKEIRWVQVHAVKMEWDGRPAAMDMVIDITERRKAEEQIQRQLRHMAALRAVDMAIAASMDLPLTLRVLLEQITGQLKVDASSILLLDKEANSLVYEAGQGFRGGYPRGTRLPVIEGLAGSAVLHHRTVRVGDLSLAQDAFWTAERVRREDFQAYVCLPLISKGGVLGVVELFNRGPLTADQAWMSFLEALGNQAAIAIDNASLLKDLHTANLELTLAYDATITGWARALELRDGDTQGHSQRVADMTVELASAMGYHGDFLLQARRGALLHDIGKMAIPDHILKKHTNLTEEEWEVMRKHPVYAFDLLSSIEFLRPALDIPYAHHEWWNGNGYPRGLAGESIPVAARIFTVVDVWDALVHDRIYHKGWTLINAINQIKSLSGEQFDPQVVDAFCDLVNCGRFWPENGNSQEPA